MVNYIRRLTMTTTINCPNCGNPNYQESAFCYKCGDKLPPFAPVTVLDGRGKTDEELLQEAHVIKPFVGILPHRLQGGTK